MQHISSVSSVHISGVSSEHPPLLLGEFARKQRLAVSHDQAVKRGFDISTHKRGKRAKWALGKELDDNFMRERKKDSTREIWVKQLPFYDNRGENRSGKNGTTNTIRVMKEKKEKKHQYSSGYRGVCRRKQKSMNRWIWMLYRIYEW